MSDVSYETAAPFRDRSVGLLVLGIAQIVIGIITAVGLLAAVAASELPGGVAVPRGALTVNIYLYTGLSLYFFSVGIGSIRRRRWARALSVVVSSWWAVIGVISIVMTLVTLPRLKVLIAPSQEKITLAIIFTTLVVLYVIVPVILVLFYRSDNVRATCEAADPRIRWTDRVPLPILALIVAMAFCAITCVAATSYGVMPLFGVILTGGPAILVTLAFALLCAFLALQFYRLKRSAWWTLLLLQVIGLIAGPLTMMRTNIDEIYAKMGLLTPQIQAMRLSDIYGSPLFWSVIAIFWLASLAYTLWVRRYFDFRGPRTRASDRVTD